MITHGGHSAQEDPGVQPPAAIIGFNRTGEDLTVYISGDLDVATAPGFAEQITRQTQAGDTVWLDLSAVSFCASAGISLIVRAELEARERDGQMVLFHPSRAVLDVLDMCHLTGHLTIRAG